MAALSIFPATATATAADTAETHWQSMGPNARGGYFAFTSAQPSRLYVLPDGGQYVFRTDDHGATWRQQPAFAMPDARGNRLAADPRHADIVYAATQTGNGSRGWLLRSDDAAGSFHTVLDVPAPVTDVVVSDSGNTVVASTGTGVYLSSDAGHRWQELPGSPADSKRVRLSGHDLFVGAGYGVYVIEDVTGHPRTARKLPLPGDLSVDQLAASDRAIVASNVLDGGYLSRDHGRSWSRLKGPWGAKDATPFTGLTATGELDVQTVQGSPDGSGAMGLWVSHDLGASWQRKPAMEKVDLYEDLGSFPDRPGEQVVYAAAGIYTTRDAVHFQRIGVPGGDVLSMTVAGKGNSAALIAGTDTGTYRSSAPLRQHLPNRYQDWSWTGTAPHTIGNRIGALATDPQHPNVVFRARNSWCGGQDCFYVERSDDGGATWQIVSTPGGNSRSLVVASSRIYAGSYLVNGVYSSDDGGKTMVLHAHDEFRGVSSVALDPRNKDVLWIGDAGGLFHSTDGGATVTKVADDRVHKVAVDPTNPDHVVAVGDKLIKVSTDGGKSFTAANRVPDALFDDVTFAPNGTVYAASRDYGKPGQGVFRSTNGGRDWTTMSTRLIDRSVDSIAVSPDGAWLFAGTSSGSVYRTSVC